MASIVRGNTVKFTVTFRDAEDVVVFPDDPILVLKFGTKEKTIDLVGQGQTFVGEWDSGESIGSNRVEYTIYGEVDGSIKVAADGSFTLSSGRANPEAIAVVE